MKDGIDPYSSELAAALSYFELSQTLENQAAIPQKLLDLAQQLGGPLAALVLPSGDHIVKTGLAFLTRKIFEVCAHKEQLNIESMLYYIASDFDRIGKDIEELKKTRRNRELFTQGLMEARLSRTEDCVKRLAAVVVSGIGHPEDPEELVTEFLRISTVLTETDVLILRAAASLPPNTGSDENQSWRNSVFAGWTRVVGDLKASGISEMTYRSALVRLQALGLAEAMDPGFGGGRAPYEVLELGRHYLGYLQASEA
jgi:hypothetical protein